MRIALIILAGGLSAGAQTFNQFRNFVDPKCTNLFERIAVRQTNFFQANGRLAQLYFTHTFYPSNNVETAADNTNAAPTSGVAWRNLDAVTNALPMRCAVNVYFGPQGWGWEAHFQAVWRSTNYVERVMQIGPETNRVYEWRRIEKP